MVPATLLKPMENGIYLLTVTPLQSFWKCNGKIPGFPGFTIYQNRDLSDMVPKKVTLLCTSESLQVTHFI